MMAFINLVVPLTIHHFQAVLIRSHSFTRFNKSKKTCLKIQHFYFLSFHHVKEEDHLSMKHHQEPPSKKEKDPINGNGVTMK